MELIAFILKQVRLFPWYRFSRQRHNSNIQIFLSNTFFLAISINKDQPENAPWPPSTKNKPNHYDQSLSTIYRPFHQDESGPKGLSSHLKYSLPNKYYDVCSHKGCRNGSKAKGSAAHMKQWPRQLLNHRIDYQRENNDEDPEYKAKMVRSR